MEGDNNSNSKSEKDELKEVMPIDFLLSKKDPDISGHMYTLDYLKAMGMKQLGSSFKTYEDNIPNVFYSFVLLSDNYTAILARRFFNYVEQVYHQERTSFLLDISNLENFEVKAILQQLEYSKKFADGGLLRVGIIEPRTALRKALQFNIFIQKRKTPIEVFEFDNDCVDWCIYGKLKTKEEKKKQKEELKAQKKLQKSSK